MGREKALLPYRAGFLGEYVARSVERAVGNVTLVGRPGPLESLGYQVLPDLYPGEGPLGGILTALEASRADWNLIVACDMPEIEPMVLGTLMEAAESQDPDVLVPSGPASLLEPLCAVYHRRSRAELSRAFSSGTRKVTDAFAGLHIVVYPFADVTPFQNVNTPADWAPYAAK